MIRIEMNRLKRTVVLELPTDYEHVLVSLWKLGLDRDPVKYTLRELKVVFHYDTPEEHQMIRMIKSSDTLMFALISLHQMIAPPYSIANVLREKISSGCYNTADEFYADMEKMVFRPSTCQSSFFFPISAELVDKKGIVKKAGDDVLLKYEYMVVDALVRTASQSLYWKTELFSDVEGAYEKLLSAVWMVERIEDTLYGHVSLVHTEPFTEEEIADLTEKIEMINSVEFAIRIKQWSVLTDDGLLFIYLCDEDGDYSLYNSGMADDEEEDDEPCMCPECQVLMRNRAPSIGSVLPDDELEESIEESRTDQ